VSNWLLFPICALIGFAIGGWRIPLIAWRSRQDRLRFEAEMARLDEQWLKSLDEFQATIARLRANQSPRSSLAELIAISEEMGLYDDPPTEEPSQ
jgi:hypothetical protein